MSALTTAVEAPAARSSRMGSKAERRLFASGRSTLVSDLGGSLTTKCGAVFALCADDGDIDLGRNPGHGVYFHDMRYLDRASLRLDGRRLSVLLSEARGDRTVCELTNGDIQLQSGEALPKERIGVRRERVLSDVLTETIHLKSYAARPVRISLEIELDAHFDSMFTVRGAPPGKRGEVKKPEWTGETLVFSYAGADLRRRTTEVSFHPPPAAHEGASGARYSLDLPARGEADVRLTITLRDEGGGRLESRPRPHARRPPFRGVSVATDNPLFDRVLDRSFEDLRMLVMSERDHDFFAAGVPWFVALFGRDSLITALETLPYDPGIAAHTLRLLAAYQGTKVDDWRDEAPGKILHELRVGEQAHLHEVPQTPYYGSVDATPLFLVLLGEHFRWAGDVALFEELRPAVDAALDWIDRFGDSDGDGFIDYAARSPKGFRNQGWKDSGNSIVNADGSLAEPPIALVEVQGYVYRAWLAAAALFRAGGDGHRADELEGRAKHLAGRFRDAYWMDDRGYLALALGKGGRRAEAIASNAGQALWSGIVDSDHAGAVAAKLVEPCLFSGWGVRTLADSEVAYNPIDYQVGAVWPHDNALIVAGLRRYGHAPEAMSVFSGIFDAAAAFPHYRLPELFAGFARGEYRVPVRYPVACNPQAWAAGAIPGMLASALGLEPDAAARRLVIADPRLPDWLGEVTVTGLRVGAATIDLRYRRVEGDTLVAVLKRDGDLDVVVTR